MPITRCSNCGTEDSMTFEGDFRSKKIAVSTFRNCPICIDPVCDSCFIPSDNACGQCVEASTTGLQHEMNTLNASLFNAAISENSYVRRRTKRILKTALQVIALEESL